MSWIKERVKATGHGIKKATGAITYEIFGKDITTGDKKGEYGVRIDYNSNNGTSISTPYYGPNANKFTGNTAGNSSGGKPAGYSRVTAKTATDIAQGGMTKDEIDNWNRNHPNETALRR